MKKLIITPELSHSQAWQASYKVTSADNVCLVTIDSRSAIEVVVAKLPTRSFLGNMTKYYVAIPNYGIAIPYITSMSESNWIAEHLIGLGMPAPDAVTIAQVLRDLGDF